MKTETKTEMFSKIEIQ